MEQMDVPGADAAAEDGARRLAVVVRETQREGGAPVLFGADDAVRRHQSPGSWAWRRARSLACRASTDRRISTPFHLSTRLYIQVLYAYKKHSIASI